jgi:uridine kinase
LFRPELIQLLCQAINAARSTRRPTLVAIDGPGCAGKTTLADKLQAALGNDATVLGIDGFLTPFTEQDLNWKPNESISDDVPHLRWRELERVIEQLANGQAARYRPYNWEDDALDPETSIPAKPIVLVEGLYSLHRRLRNRYGFKLWIDTCRNTRRANVEARDGGRLLWLWNDIYVPREWSYMQQQRPFEHANAFLLGADLEWPTTDVCFSRQAA